MTLSSGGSMRLSRDDYGHRMLTGSQAATGVYLRAFIVLESYALLQPPSSAAHPSPDRFMQGNPAGMLSSAV
jgi:hypothetical protein